MMNEAQRVTVPAVDRRPAGWDRFGEPAGTVPACPWWCDLGDGHGFDLAGPDGAALAWHEGTVAKLIDDQGLPVRVVVACPVTRRQDGQVTSGDPFITVSAPQNGAEFSSRAGVAMLVEALHAAGRFLEH